MVDGSPTLEVGFEIGTDASFETLRQLQAAMETTEAKVMREAAKMEKATAGMVNLGGATSQVKTFGNAYTREMESLSRSTKYAENAAERMIKQLDWQAMTFGKTSQEIREMRVEQRALAAESRGLTDVANRLRAANAEMQRLEGTGNRLNATVGRSRGTMMQFGYQLNDVATMAALGAPPMQIFASQAGQVVQVVQGAEGGLRGFATQLGGMALKFAPLIIVAGTAAAALGLFTRSVESGIDTQSMIDGLGLTSDEIKKLENTSVTSGDVITATFQVLAKNVGIDMSNMTKWFGDAMDWMTKVGRQYLAALYSQFVGTFRAIGAIVQGVFSGKGVGEIMSDIGDAYKGAFNEADQALIQFGKDVTAQVESNKLADLQKQAAAIKADRSSRTNRAGDRIAREAAATEAQIRNLYLLADAYKESGAAALIAEARVKAESKAIKQRGDIEAYVNREVRLAIAQRVTDAAKATASVREQADAQELVNGMVQAGLVPAERAQQLVQDQIDDLPLLAALQAAQQRGLAEEAAKATQALADQRAERERLRAIEEQAVFNNEMAAGSNRIEMLQEELRLIGATNAERNIALATLEAMQRADAMFTDPAKRDAYIEQQRQIAILTEQIASETRALNDELTFAADRWDLIARNVQNAATGMADAFGEAGRAIGDMALIFASFHATRSALEEEHRRQIELAGEDQRQIARENAKYALRTATLEIGTYGDMAAAAKGFFDEKSKGYKQLMAAEKAFRAIEFALSVKAMAQDIKETGLKILNSGAKAAASAVEAVAKAIASLPFPANLAAGAATAAALTALGIEIAGSFGGGGKSKLEPSNTGTGTVLGDPEAQSASIKNAINALKDVNTTTSIYSREMAASLRSINNQIGGLANVLVRSGNIDASAGISTGFEKNLIGKVLGSIPLIGGVLGGLFGTKKTIVGGGLYGGPQSLEDILSGGFDAQTYTDIKKKKKFFGITTSTKYKTTYGEADQGLEDQFTLLLRSFNDAILAAAGPLGSSTSEITERLQNFVLDIGKIDLKDLTGAEIEEKLQAVFGAAADDMAAAAFPGIERFQKVGEGAFETLVRVASTVEAVTMSLDMLGTSLVGIDMKMALADQFDSVADFTSAVGGYFEAFYSEEEQLAARTAQMTDALNSMGLVMPDSLAGFRSLVEAQDLTTEAGQRAYAMLLQMAPAFADLQEAMSGAKSAADIAAERENLQRQIYQLVGNIEAIRALDLAKIDESNKALQEQVWAIQDAQEAAKAAQELKDAWSSVGDSIMDEVARIKGLSGQQTGANFATLMGQFNAATEAARAGDMEAAQDLPGLSQAMLAAAALVATSRQELDRVQADTVASLEATNAAIEAYANGQQTDAQIVDAANTTQQASSANDNENEILRLAYEDMKAELAGMRAEMANGISTIANNTGKTRRILEDVSADSGGNAFTTVYGAA